VFMSRAISHTGSIDLGHVHVIDINTQDGINL
jgi:hypothetical protein